MKSGYALGIDGGGTKTEAAIVDPEGRTVGRGIAGASNASFLPRRAAVSAFRKAIRQALKEAAIDPAAITAAGCTFGFGAVQACKELGINVGIGTLSEGQVAFERAGISEFRGVVVIAGTGSHVAGFDGQEGRFGIGGWGAILGDDGSAYDIGLRAVRQVLMSAEGRMPPTSLGELANRYFDVQGTRWLVSRLAGTKVQQSLVAGFATKVYEAACGGDEAAVQILEEAGEQLGEMAAFVARRLFQSEDSFPILLSGGVFNAGDLVVGPIRSVLTPQFANSRIIVPKSSPGEAAARLALRGVRLLWL